MKSTKYLLAIFSGYNNLTPYQTLQGKLINCTFHAHQESRKILKPVIRPSGTCGLKA